MRDQIIVANKSDILDTDRVDIAAFEKYVKENGWEMMYISAYTGENLGEMIKMVEKRLQTLPPIMVYEREYDESDAFVSSGKSTEIRREGNKFIVEGEWLYNLMGQINFDDYESLNYFQRALQKGGVFEALEQKGCTDGDTVSIYEFEFDYVK